MSVEWITYKSKSILCSRYTNEDQFGLLMRTYEMELQAPGLVIELADFTEAKKISGEFMEKVKELSKGHRKQKIAKTALLGVQGMKRVLLSAYLTLTGEKNIKTFDTETAALDWLIS